MIGKTNALVAATSGGGSFPNALPVTNLSINASNVLSWSEPDLSAFNDYEYTLTYIVSINGGEATRTTSRSLNLSTYLVVGSNVVSVVADVGIITRKDSSSVSDTKSYTPSSNTITTLARKLPNSQTMYSMGSGAVGNNIYLFGGFYYSTSVKYDTILVFDTTNNTLTTLQTTLPSGTYSMGTGVVGNNIYLFGGWQSGTGSLVSYNNTIMVFDTTSNTITTLQTTLPVELGDMGSCAVGNNIYLFGGNKGYSNGNTKSDTIMVFDTTNNTLTTLQTTLPEGNYLMGTGVVGNNIYLFGGITSGRSDKILVFDTTNNTLTTLSTTLPSASSNMAGCAVGNNIYLFGGTNSNGGIVKTIVIFDTTSNTITTSNKTLPSNVSSPSAEAVGNHTYIFGGYQTSNICRYTP